MAELTKDWLRISIEGMETNRELFPGDLDDNHDKVLEALKLALASMEQEPVAWPNHCDSTIPAALRFLAEKPRPIYGNSPYNTEHLYQLAREMEAMTRRPLYAAPQLPQPAVPDAISTRQAISKMEECEPCDSINVAYKYGWNACRAAMLQGKAEKAELVTTIQAAPSLDISLKNAESVNTIKPVADLFEVTVPSGRSTAFTKDAAEAKDCSDMGWEVQEYVTLERYQEAMLQGTELDFREISNSSTKHFRETAETSTKCWCHTCRPVTMSDMRFVVCPECGNKRCPHANDHRNACTGSNEPGQEGSAYPAAPQQEVKP